MEKMNKFLGRSFSSPSMKANFYWPLICVFFNMMLPVKGRALEATPEARTALVVGCDYKGTSLQLPSPVKDAESIAATLKNKLDFRVTLLTNPTRKELLDAVDSFGSTLAQNKGVGLFYFSGHGAQHEGDNYLIPVRAELGFREDLPTECIAAERIVVRMEAAKNRVNLLFLDACRSNDLPSSKATKKGLVSKGLAAMNAASGMLISFATARNSAANDSGEGSFYTNALVKHIATPGISVTDMLTIVNNEVKRETGGEQIPFMEVGLDGIFCFAEGTSIPPPTTITTSAPPRGDAPPAPTSAVSRDVFYDSPYAAYNDYSKQIILRRVQDKLSTAGYYSGALDGKAGPILRQALADYQRTFSLARSGALDAPTLQSLKLDGMGEQASTTVAHTSPESSEPRPKPKPTPAVSRPRTTPPTSPTPTSDDLDAKFRRAAEMFEKKK